ncbi:unnamed protein product, partial [Protopolystoma xenopodis]
QHRKNKSLKKRHAKSSDPTEPSQGFFGKLAEVEGQINSMPLTSLVSVDEAVEKAKADKKQIEIQSDDYDDEDVNESGKSHRKGSFVFRFWHSCSSFVGLFVRCKERGTYLVMAYLLFKLLMLANAIGQLFMMQRFLGFPANDTMYGLMVLRNLLDGRDWQATLVFPRVTYCTTRLKQLGVLHNTLTSQCVLPVNMLNEKIYIFLWWWISLAAALVVFSIGFWFNRLIFLSNGSRFVLKFLLLHDKVRQVEREIVDKFAKKFLRRDGLFVLRMIYSNNGELITSELVCELWDSYKARVNQKINPFTGVGSVHKDTSSGDTEGKERHPNALSTDHRPTPPVLRDGIKSGRHETNGSTELKQRNPPYPVDESTNYHKPQSVFPIKP